MHTSVGTARALTQVSKYTARVTQPVQLHFTVAHSQVSSAQVRVEIESLADGVDLSEPLTRARFEELVGDLLKKTLGPVKKVTTILFLLPRTMC